MDATALNPEIIEGQDPVVEGQVADNGAEGETIPQTETQEPADPARQTKEQTKEENATIAAARKEAEYRARQEAEKRAALEAENQRLLETMGKFGYQAESPAQLADILEAQHRNITIQQLQEERKAQEAQIQKALENSPVVQQLKAEKEALQQRESQRLFSDDLKVIKDFNPKESAKEITDLGETFIKAKAMGLDTLTAYELVQKERERTTRPTPPEIGKVNSSTGAAKEFYTSEEVDRLTPQQLDDPKILERVMRSMTKW